MKSEHTSHIRLIRYNFCDFIRMNYRFSLLILGLIFLTKVVVCQTTISGNLIDENNEPIPFAKINLTKINNNSTVLDESGFDGEFKIDSLSIGHYSIKFSAVGYESCELEFDLNGDTVINKTLLPGPEVFDEIVVVGYAVPLIDCDDQAFVQVKMVPKDCNLDTIRRQGNLAPLEVGKFLTNYLQYPAYSLAEMEQGSVFARFKIDSLGNVRGIQIVKGVSECLDNQVKSALLCMPKVVMMEKLPNGRYNYNGTNAFKEGEYVLPVKFVLN